ncbi:MAG: AbrB/MazE/SpoVT family DNA-binding domain-containing protein [Dehalococcoidia bacterium]
MARKRRAKYDAGSPPEETPGHTEPETSGVYERGQTVIPKQVRDALAIEHGTRLRWEVREGVIHVMPIPKNPVQAAVGFLKGTGYTFEKFMKERQAERVRERELEADEERRWRTYSTRPQS